MRTVAALAFVAFVGATNYDAAGQPAAPDARMREIIAEVEKAEQLFRDLETKTSQTVQWADPPRSAVLALPQDPFSSVEQRVGEESSGPLRPQTEESVHAIVQGDLFYCEHTESRLLAARKTTKRRISAFDGQTTRHIEYGNCVNLVHGRQEPWQLSPPNSWALAQWQVSFPLSVFLRGTDAIADYPKTRRQNDANVNLGFYRVECSFEGEETLDGLRCLKIGWQHWSGPSGSPSVGRLWLAPDRSCLCVRAQQLRGGKVYAESRVEEFREPSPRTWLPARITTLTYANPPTGEAKVTRRTIFILNDAVRNPGKQASFFRDISLPEELPVYTIRDGGLEGSPLNWPAKSDDGRLQEIIKRVRAEEKQYESIDAEVKRTYQLLRDAHYSRDSNEYAIQEASQRYVVDGPRAYFHEERNITAADGSRFDQSTTQAYDGRWTRACSRYREGTYASAQQAEKMNRLRPHMLLLSYLRWEQPLSEWLSGTRADDCRAVAEYLGESQQQGLACDIVRLSMFYGDSLKASGSEIFWLARDRNYLPVRRESYSRRFAHGLPEAISTASDWREIAPGVWYPFFDSTDRFDAYGVSALSHGRLVIGWREDLATQTITLKPQVSPSLFTDVVVPQGTEVLVSDAEGNRIGTYPQQTTGNLIIQEGQLGVLRASEELKQTARDEARLVERDWLARQQALEALVGKPAPAISEVTWLNSPPLTWQSLRGKPVVVHFWSQESEDARREIEQLSQRLNQASRQAVGIVAVHACRAAPEEVSKRMKELGVQFPVCIDAAPGSSLGTPWGILFDWFAVRKLPQSFLIDREGKVAAHGDLKRMLGKAQEVTK
jgi:hypothetical protein